MNASVLENALWAASIAGHISVLILLIRRQVRGFRFFTFYLGYYLFESAVMLLISHLGSKHVYFVAYYAGGYLDFALLLAAAVEMVLEILRPLKMIVIANKRSIFLWSTFGFVTMAALSLGIGPGSDGHSNSFDLWENRTSAFLSMLICGTVCSLFAVASRVYLFIPKHALAIAQGLFVSSYCVLLADLAQAYLHGRKPWSSVVDYALECSYLLVLVYWTIGLWKPEEIKPPMPSGLISQMIELHAAIQDDLKRLEEPTK